MKALLTLLLIAVVVSGCGDSSSPAASTTKATPTTTQASPSTTEATPTTTQAAAAETDLIDSAAAAAAIACGDGNMTAADLDTYVDTIKNLGIAPSSALSRGAVIVECGASDNDVLAWLP